MASFGARDESKVHLESRGPVQGVLVRFPYAGGASLQAYSSGQRGGKFGALSRPTAGVWGGYGVGGWVCGWAQVGCVGWRRGGPRTQLGPPSPRGGSGRAGKEAGGPGSELWVYLLASGVCVPIVRVQIDRFAQAVRGGLGHAVCHVRVRGRGGGRFQ